MKRKPIEKEKCTHRSLRRNSLENAAGLVFTGSREAVFNVEGLVPRDDANKRIDLLKINIGICLKFTGSNSVILVSDSLSARPTVHYNTHNQSVHLHNSIIHYIIDCVFLQYQK